MDPMMISMIKKAVDHAECSPKDQKLVQILAVEESFQLETHGQTALARADALKAEWSQSTELTGLKQYWALRALGWGLLAKGRSHARAEEFAWKYCALVLSL